MIVIKCVMKLTEYTYAKQIKFKRLLFIFNVKTIILNLQLIEVEYFIFNYLIFYMIKQNIFTSNIWWFFIIYYFILYKYHLSLSLSFCPSFSRNFGNMFLSCAVIECLHRIVYLLSAELAGINSHISVNNT